MRVHSLSAIHGTPSNITETNNGFLDSTQSVNDPSVVTRLQEEIAMLKHEIRAVKFKHGESNTPNLSVRIADPVENGREGKSFTQPAPTPSPRPPRPQLGKRSVTCHTYQEMCVRKRRRRRSSSFSGPYLQRRSLDLGALFSELADPLLVLKAENKDLHRKLQEARISEAGKLAKVLHENAQLNRRIVEMNIQNAPSDEAEKVSRLLKENSELKRQLGEVSILNSAWCDVTPRSHRKQNEDRKISKDLREVRIVPNSQLKRLNCPFYNNWQNIRELIGHPRAAVEPHKNVFDLLNIQSKGKQEKNRGTYSFQSGWGKGYRLFYLPPLLQSPPRPPH